MRNVIKYSIYYFYSKIIIFSLFFYKLRKAKYLYTDHFGFGDFVVFCYIMNSKIKKKKFFVLVNYNMRQPVFFLKKSI